MRRIGQAGGKRQRYCDAEQQAGSVQPWAGRGRVKVTQATAGKEWYDPAAEYGHHRRHQPQPGKYSTTLPQFVLVQPAGQGQPLAGGNQQHQYDDRVVVAQAPLQDRSCQAQCHQWQEAALDQYQQATR